MPNKEVKAMKLELSDIETNAVKHALERYEESLKKDKGDKGIEYELDAITCVMEKMDAKAHVAGV